MTRTLAPLALLSLTACFEATPHQPTLDEVSTDGDAAVDLVDRAAVLAGAVENEAGQAIDLSAPPRGFLMQIDSEDLQTEAEDEGDDSTMPDAPAAPATFRNITAAAYAMVWADAATITVLGPPAAAIAIASQGEITEIEPWLWNATNSVTGPNGSTAEVDLNVAWVGVGWLAEMRLSTDDGAYDDTLWFNGFLSLEAAVGWWDIYANDQVVGVVEWIAEGQGNAQFGIAALGGEAAGDALSYMSNDQGQDLVSYYDASAGYLHYVWFEADRSGEVALSTYNGGQPACWTVDFADGPCPVD